MSNCETDHWLISNHTIADFLSPSLIKSNFLVDDSKGIFGTIYLFKKIPRVFEQPPTVSKHNVILENVLVAHTLPWSLTDKQWMNLQTRMDIQFQNILHRSDRKKGSLINDKDLQLMVFRKHLVFIQTLTRKMQCSL